MSWNLVFLVNMSIIYIIYMMTKLVNSVNLQDVGYYDLKKSLKKEDALLRRRRGGVLMYADIRGKTPYDRVEFFSVPVGEQNRRILKFGTVFGKLKSLSRKMEVPVVFFVIFHEAVVFFIVQRGKCSEIRFISPDVFFRSLLNRKTLFSAYGRAKRWEERKLPPETQDSAIAYSYFHNILPETCWCVDIDCFDGAFFEVKRRGECLTYNQRVLRRLVQRAGYDFHVIHVSYEE